MFGENTIDNFICMCYQNIHGIKSCLDGTIVKGTPWKEWIENTIDCALSFFDNELNSYSGNTDYYEVFHYATVVNNGRDFSKEKLIEFLNALKKEDSVKQSINLLNLVETIKFNEVHKEEYIHKVSKDIVKLTTYDIEVRIGNDKYICVGISDKDSHYMVTRTEFDENYIPNKKIFDFIIKDELDQEPTSQYFKFTNEIIY